MSKKDEFKTRLKLAKDRIKKSEIKNDEKSSSNIGHAFKISTELLAAVIVGTIIGFILDNWFGTKPLLILIFFFMGVAAGIVNVVRSARNMQRKK
jgi:ATP synthase protein I|tara:strand:- start:1389 stop:1673 length:285 start_codon:yes stop_codon:yes gene_type:complete